MEKTTYADARVKEALRAFVVMKVDTDAEPGVAEGMGVVALPDIRVIDPDGSEVYRSVDYLSPEKLLDVLSRFRAHAVP